MEYETPAGSDGMGTRSLLLKDDQPISGVAILAADDPTEMDLMKLGCPIAAGDARPSGRPFFTMSRCRAVRAADGGPALRLARDTRSWHIAAHDGIEALSEDVCRCLPSLPAWLDLDRLSAIAGQPAFFHATLAVLVVALLTAFFIRLPES